MVEDFGKGIVTIMKNIWYKVHIKHCQISIGLVPGFRGVMFSSIWMSVSISAAISFSMSCFIISILHSAISFFSRTLVMRWNISAVRTFIITTRVFITRFWRIVFLIILMPAFNVFFLRVWKFQIACFVQGEILKEAVLRPKGVFFLSSAAYGLSVYQNTLYAVEKKCLEIRRVILILWVERNYCLISIYMIQYGPHSSLNLEDLYILELHV